MALLTPSSTKRLLDDPIIDVQQMKRRSKGLDVGPVKLKISRKFAGALLQWELTVIFLLKAKVYGRSPADDVHGFDLAQRKWDLMTVTSIVHGCTQKLLIGTLSFSVLVTAALNITTGDVSAGA
ncbi:hypothetical protein BGX20_000098, partial [Mortierella sp. AD010]